VAKGMETYNCVKTCQLEPDPTLDTRHSTLSLG